MNRTEAAYDELLAACMAVASFDGCDDAVGWKDVFGRLTRKASQAVATHNVANVPVYSSAAEKVFKLGFAPSLGPDRLRGIKAALEADDARMVQGRTTTPPPLLCVQDWPVQSCCGVAWAGWQVDGLTTVGEVEEFFAKTCFDADQRLGEPAACRWFLNWFDDTPRAEMLATLSRWIDEVLAIPEAV